jgi:natural product precursor
MPVHNVGVTTLKIVRKTKTPARGTTPVIPADLLNHKNLNKMKKQIKKLSLNKKTISNLSSSEMNKHVGGSFSYFVRCGHCGATGNGNTCYGHNTCNGQNTCYGC